VSVIRLAKPAVFFVIFALIGTMLTRVSAQGNPVMVLNDATPSADILVTLASGAPGVVYMELSGVRVVLKDSSGADVLSLADKRVSALGIQIAQGAATHTLHLERLPGLATGQARVVAQSTLPDVIGVTSSSNTVMVLDKPASSQIPVSPAATIPVTINAAANMLSVQFPLQEATVQLVDSAGGVVLTTLAGREITGLSVRAEPGQYTFSVANRDLAAQSSILVALSPAPDISLPDLAALAEPTQTPVESANLPTCTAQINVASVNLRSGPGTGYSVLGYVMRDTNMPVGGVNKQGGWVLVQSPVGGAWVAQSVATLSGSCDNLKAYDIPLRSAVARAPAVQPIQPVSGPGTGVTVPGGSDSSSSGGEHDREGDDHDD
jgi:uncharacterized protein YraI